MGNVDQSCTLLNEHYQEVLNVIGALEPDDALSIKQATEVLSSPALKLQLGAIAANFMHLVNSITALEESGMPLKKAMQIVNSLRNELEQNDGIIGGQINDKLKDLLVKNKGFKKLQAIGEVLSDVYTHEEELRNVPPHVLIFVQLHKYFLNVIYFFTFYCITDNFRI